MNKLILLIIGSILLTGCEKRDPSKPLISVQPTITQPSNPHIVNVLLMGQSNAAYMNGAGTDAFTATLGKQTVINRCAVPGTYIKDWKPTSTYFTGCLAHMPNPDVMLWYQGESDASPNGDYQTWASQFTDIVIAVRTQAGRPIPVVYAQLARDQTNDYPGFPLPGWMSIKDQQASLHLANATMITTDDIDPDGIHFTQTGYQQLGQRFATALKQLEAIK